MEEKKNFYEEQIEKIQEEFRNVPEKETRRRLDLMQIMGSLETQLSKSRKEEYMNVKEKLYIDWSKEDDGYNVITYSNGNAVRFKSENINDVYARLKRYN